MDSKFQNNNNGFGDRTGSRALPLRLCDPSLPPPRGEIYLVEDDPGLQRAILRMLREADLLARAYDRAAAFLQDSARLPPGCLLTDLSLPGMDGLALMRRVRTAGLPLTMVLISGHADVRVAVEAMKAGASEVIEKPFNRATLVAAVTLALGVCGVRARAVGARAEPWRAGLTDREREVLDAVVAGATNKQIARSLRISPRTVEIYRASVMRKTGATSLPQLVRLAMIAERDPAEPGAEGSRKPPIGA